MAKEKVYKCFYCKQDILEYPQKIQENSRRYIHQECIDSYRKEQSLKIDIENKRKEEYESWNTLYQYIKKEILKVDGVLPKHMINKLKALRNGEYNLRRGDKVEKGCSRVYTYETILKTIQVNKVQILKGIRSVEFKDDTHMVNYIISIITNNINDVDRRVKAREKANERLEDIVIDVNENAEYRQTNDLSNNKVAKVLDDLF